MNVFIYYPQEILLGFIMKTTLPPLTKEDIDRAILEIAPTAIRDEILTTCDVDFMHEIIYNYGVFVHEM